MGFESGSPVSKLHLLCQGQVCGAHLVQLLQGPLLLLELGDGVFPEREVPGQGADLVIQGLEVGAGERDRPLRLGTPLGEALALREGTLQLGYSPESLGSLRDADAQGTL